MSMQYRPSLNGRKYIQLTFNNPKIYLTKHRQVMLLHVLVHVKPPMLAVVLVELGVYTFTQSVSECLCRAHNMNQVTQSVGFSHPCRLTPILDTDVATCDIVFILNCKKIMSTQVSQPPPVAFL